MRVSEMKLRTFAGLMLSVSILLAAVIGVAGARTGGSTATTPTMKIGALGRPFSPTSKQRRELAALRRQISRSPRATIASTANAPDARPVPLPEGLDDAWVSEADDGAICTFIPDPLGGYGASCTTQADLRLGGAVTVLGGAGRLKHQAVVVMVVPDGGQDPVVTEPDGTQRHQDVDGIGAAILPESARVTIGGVSLEIPKFNPKCASIQNGDFRQCGL
jgi:hypothetical protein